MLFYISCSTETIDVENDIVDTSDVQNAFTLDKFKDPFIKENLTVNWDNYNLIGDQNTVYEFDAYLNNEEDSEDHALGYKIRYKVLATKNVEKVWVYDIVKLNVIEPKDDNNISIAKLHSFTGTLYEYNINGETLWIKAVNKGTIVDQKNLAI